MRRGRLLSRACGLVVGHLPRMIIGNIVKSSSSREPARHAFGQCQWLSKAFNSKASACSKGDGPLAVFDVAVAEGQLMEDAQLRKAADVFNKLYHQLVDSSYSPQCQPRSVEAPTGFFSKLLGSESAAPPSFERGDVPFGVYLYGSVGCGKTMMMDLFFDTVPTEKKRRTHFNAFMSDVHQRIHRWKGQQAAVGLPADEPIPALAEELASEAWLLCFDELQVTDIVDAGILRSLFHELARHGVVIVATSNRPPGDLYANGLAREVFLPCIAAIERDWVVHCMNSDLDYRAKAAEVPNALTMFFSPLGPATDAALGDLFSKLAQGNAPQPRCLSILGRSLRVPAAAGRIAQFAFHDICGPAQPLGSSDFLLVATQFHTLFLTHVPVLTIDMEDETRRFITLVDILYDKKVKLIMSCAVPIAQLMAVTAEERQLKASHDTSSRQLLDDLSGGAVSAVVADFNYRTGEALKKRTDTGSKHVNTKANVFSGLEQEFAFHRTLSRLGEMQTAGYLRTAWLGNVDEQTASVSQTSQHCGVQT